ncbi:MAG: Uncharacterized protein RBG13Loki_3441 [Promethearchaeota archaeon CR_4]|nr:MAG: Uncharacterized protein RBG13Loki_3441 [Candidatus Lokiarchaeota archaeon CR_4]
MHLRVVGDVGSPPHTWGQCREADDALFLVRFTPTYVGTILVVLLYLSDWTVHPHIRGDNTAKPTRAGSAGGSPPHTWGQYDTI